MYNIVSFNDTDNGRNEEYFYVCLGGVVVSVMDSHSCDRGSSPDQGKHIYDML